MVFLFILFVTGNLEFIVITSPDSQCECHCLTVPCTGSCIPTLYRHGSRKPSNIVNALVQVPMWRGSSYMHEFRFPVTDLLPSTPPPA